MSHESYHEPYDKLPERTRDFHRAIISLIEELEAVDWYQQRADVTPDPELKAVMLHHRDEEIEHAMMNLEWLRRRDEVIDRNARVYLFSEGPITEVEEAVTGGPSERGTVQGRTGEVRGPGGGEGGSLGIGSLKRP
jgi:uncharacterized protein